MAFWVVVSIWCVCSVCALVSNASRMSHDVVDTAWHGRFAAGLSRALLGVTQVDRLMSRSMILTLREVLTKRHCVLKERLRLGTRDKGTKSQSDGLQIRKTDAVIV